MAPVAGEVAHGEEDGLVLLSSCCKGLLALGVPVHGIVGMLQEVGALLGEEAVGSGKGFIYHGNLIEALRNINALIEV
jgi:hypothetical protein